MNRGAESLRKAISEADQTHEIAAEFLKISRPYLSKVLNGKALPGPLLMRRIARLYRGKVDPGDFYRDPRNANGTGK